MTEPTKSFTQLMQFRVIGAPGSRLGELHAGKVRLPCALGRSGLVAEKKEGDGGTPIGRFPLREVFYRPDRVDLPETGLPVSEIAPSDGWCDAPDDAAYNKPVALPYPASAENMWRDDHAYDLVVVVGYNDAPPVPGKGSAIFMHLVKERDGDFTPTAGCVALKLDDMIALLRHLTPETEIVIEAV